MNNQKNLLEYFSSFNKGGIKHKFENLYAILEKESEMKIGDDIILDGLVIPNIGPSEGILKFHQLLKPEDGWNEMEIKQVEKLCNIFYGNLFSDDDECIQYIDLLLNVEDLSDRDLLENVKSWLEGNTTIDSKDMERLLQNDNIFCQGVARYVVMSCLDDI